MNRWLYSHAVVEENKERKQGKKTGNANKHYVLFLSLITKNHVFNVSLGDNFIAKCTQMYPHSFSWTQILLMWSWWSNQDLLITGYWTRAMYQLAHFIWQVRKSFFPSFKMLDWSIFSLLEMIFYCGCPFVSNSHVIQSAPLTLVLCMNNCHGFEIFDPTQ